VPVVCDAARYVSRWLSLIHGHRQNFANLHLLQFQLGPDVIVGTVHASKVELGVDLRGMIHLKIIIRNLEPRQEYRSCDGVILKHFTARDVISRWDVVEVYERATARVATQFLDTLLARSPVPIRAIQVDGGSEFYADFEAACQQRQIRLFALPPRSPKLNGAVERAQRTHTEEFYEVTPCAWTITGLNTELRAWEQIYNTIRPHQALAYRTPVQFLQEQGIIAATCPSLSHMSWTSTAA